jgi:hypothetical protein
MGQDSKYFASTKKGEVSELRVELASPDLDVMKDAVKKVRAAAPAWLCGTGDNMMVYPNCAGDCRCHGGQGHERALPGRRQLHAHR